MTPDQHAEVVALLNRIATALESRPAAAPKAPSAPASASGGATLPNYGKAKGQPIHGASLDDLRYYAKGCERTLADPEKARFHGKERQMLAAIEAEIARQTGGAPAQPPADDFGEVPF